MSLAAPDPLYGLMEQRLAEWALARPDIRAVVIIGSRARREHPADPWSDLDCIVFVDAVEAVEAYRRPGPWKTELEARLQGQAGNRLAFEPWFGVYEPHETGDLEWEIIFSQGLKIDLLFSFNRSAKGQQASLADMLPVFPYQNVFERGLRVLVEKNSSTEPLQPLLRLPARPSLPGQFEFDNAIAGCLLSLVRAAKLGSRGELWRAARAINEQFQHDLLTLLEWQARAQHGLEYDTWRYGRFLEEWVDSRAAAQLPATYTNNTLPGIRQAIGAALDLLGWLGPSIAERIPLRYPAETVQLTGAWLRETLSIQEE